MFKLLVTVVPVTESKGWRGEQEGQRPSSGWVCGGVCSAIPTIHSKTRSSPGRPCHPIAEHPPQHPSRVYQPHW